MGTYSFLDVQCTLSGPGGVLMLGSSAGAAEEGITVSMAEEKNTMTIGAGGEVMHSLHASKAGQITVRLLKTSPMNAALGLMYAFQTTSSANHGQNTIVVSNLERGDLLSAQQVAFARLPDNHNAKDGGIMEWVFHCGVIDEIIGTGVADVNV